MRRSAIRRRTKRSEVPRRSAACSTVNSVSNSDGLPYLRRVMQQRRIRSWWFRSVVSVLLRALGKFLNTIKPGPAGGGLRRPSSAGSDTAVTSNPPDPPSPVVGSAVRFRSGGRGSGEVGVFLVPFPAAAKDRDAEEVQHRGAGVDQQAQGGGGRRDQNGEQVDEPWEHRQGQPGVAVTVIQPLPQQVRPAGGIPPDHHAHDRDRQQHQTVDMERHRLLVVAAEQARVEGQQAHRQQVQEVEPDQAAVGPADQREQVPVADQYMPVRMKVTTKALNDGRTSASASASDWPWVSSGTWISRTSRVMTTAKTPWASASTRAGSWMRSSRSLDCAARSCGRPAWTSVSSPMAASLPKPRRGAQAPPGGGQTPSSAWSRPVRAASAKAW